MSETAVSEAPDEMTADEVRELIENATRSLCEAFAGVPLFAHLGVARRLVEVVVYDMAHRGYGADALHMLQQLDADIVAFHNSLIEAMTKAPEAADAPTA
jgi:hypothetical protein